VDAARVAERFGLGGDPHLSDAPVARGRMGEVWRLDTGDGSWAVKVPFDPVDEDEVAPSARFQEAAYDAGVPTPPVVRTVEGDVFADLGPLAVRVYGWVDLLAPDPMLDPETVGRVVAAIHGVDVQTCAPADAWYRDPVGAAVWDEVVTSLRRAGAPFADRLADLRDELVALESWLADPATLRACHRDLWADNLLPTAGGGVCVVDWENSGAADPGQELACVLFEFGRTDPERARALATAYRDAGGPGEVREREDFTMLIAQLGHIVEVAARDWLQPNRRSPDRGTAAAWIAETLDDPHTQHRLDALLDAVRGSA